MKPGEKLPLEYETPSPSASLNFWRNALAVIVIGSVIVTVMAIIFLRGR